MKIAVVGTGAMGSVYAALLGDAGNDVWAIDVWQEHIDAINQNGLRLEGASGDRTVKIKATTDHNTVGACDLVVVATKAGEVESAATSVPALLHDDSVVLTIQNGLGSADRLAASISAERLLIGVAGGFGASLSGPGHAHHNGMELIRLGEMIGGMSARLKAIETLWRDAGFNVKAYEDINQLVWEKFICNVTFSGTCTVFNRTISQVMNDPLAWRIALQCGFEAHQAGVAKGVYFSFEDAEAYITKFGQGLPNARPSMLLDHLAGRRSEIDVINGAVPAVAEAMGTTAPYNEVITALVKAREEEFS